jgi:2-polyprenyl-3-methyl-5-hydroxy-6-metoxy-1,4-benzoquinol methylase
LEDAELSVKTRVPFANYEGGSMSSYVYSDSDRREMLSFVPSSTRSVLDVGCGKGGFGGAVKADRPGVEVWGMDSSPEVIERATAALDRFVLGLFPDDSPDRRFDCLTFNDSLEHMPDPWGALREAQRLLTEDGVIVVSLPNIRQYSIIRMLVLKGDWEYRDTGIMDRTHLRFFTRKSALRLFEECGFTVSECVPMAVANQGWKARLLSRLGNRAVEFRARHFAFVARPTKGGPADLRS